MSTEQTKRGNGGRIAIILVGVVLLSAVGFFAYKYYDEKGKNTEATENIGDLETEIDNLEVDIQEYERSLADQDMELEEKELLLAEKEQELLDKQKRIDQLLRDNRISKEKAGQLQAQMERLEYYIGKYQTEIADLKTRVAELESEKAEMGEEITALTAAKHEADMERHEALSVLEAAKILKVFDWQFFQVSKRKEKEDTEFRRGRLDNLRIQFKIMENNAATAEKKTIYLQIISPSGKVVTDAGKQSGKFTHYDEEKPYSTMTSIDYDKTTTPVTLDFERPESMDWEKGEYKVIAYADGYDISASGFTVK